MSVLALVPAPSVVLSSYDEQGRTGGLRTSLVALAARPGGVVAADVARGLVAFHEAVLAQQGDFRVTDCHRSADVQGRARVKYERWVAAGKPKPGTPAFDAARMKAAYVAKPGKSGHNGGRSVDVDTGSLRFPTRRDLQIDVLWECAEEAGWTPVIKAPTEGAAESWHFDYWGELRGVYDRLGYEQAMLAASLLVGHAAEWQSDQRVVQALLHRAGYDVGEIDGVIGPRTVRGLGRALGREAAAVEADVKLTPWDLFGALRDLPAQAGTIWRI